MSLLPDPLPGVDPNNDDSSTGANILACSANPTGHRTSPWFRLQLTLHIVASAKERYRQWAAQQWDATHYTRTVQHQTPDGGVEEFTLRNPYPARVSTKA